MNPKTVIEFKREGSSGWKVRQGKDRFIIHEGISRLLRTISTMIMDKDLVISGRLEVLRKKKT